MQDVANRPLTPVVELDAKGRPKAAPKKGVPEEPIMPQGFVVDGFPRTQVHTVSFGIGSVGRLRRLSQAAKQLCCEAACSFAI